MSIKTETFLGIPFANNAGASGRFDITATNETQYPQKATFEEGFPAITRISTSAGGKNPFGQDFNGMFYLITSAIRELQAGKTLTYNEDFANAIGGYTVGAKVTGSDGLIYICTADGNTSDPTGLDGWQTFLSSETDSESETQAATPKAVKAAYDLAKKANDKDYEFNGGTVTGNTNFTGKLQQNGSDVITEKTIASNLQEIGVNQKWQDVTNSRASNVTYTNSTNKPIVVNFMVSSSGNSSSSAEIYVDNILVSKSITRYGEAEKVAFVTAIVPSNSTYKVIGLSGVTPKLTVIELR